MCLFFQDVSALDTSFELPIDTRDDGVMGGPIPLGDEVIEKRLYPLDLFTN